MIEFLKLFEARSDVKSVRSAWGYHKPIRHEEQMSFDVDGEHYLVYCKLIKVDNEQDGLRVDFSSAIAHEKKVEPALAGLRIMQGIPTKDTYIELEPEKPALTDKRHAHQVLSGVMECVDAFIKNVRDDGVKKNTSVELKYILLASRQEYEGDERRQRIYHKLLERELSKRGIKIHKRTSFDDPLDDPFFGTLTEIEPITLGAS